jgi:hypothetical protein
MKQCSIDYADKQIAKIVSSPMLFCLIFLLAACSVAGFFIRLEFGVQWASTVGLILTFGGATILAFYLHKQAGSPTEDQLLKTTWE